MGDTALSQLNDASPVVFKNGGNISISIKGTFVGKIAVQRWHSDYGYTAPNANYIGTVQEYEVITESVDIVGGSYYYRMVMTEYTSGTAYVHIQ